MSGAAFAGVVDGTGLIVSPTRDGSFTVTGPDGCAYGRVGTTAYQGRIAWSAFLPGDSEGVSVPGAQEALEYLKAGR